MLFEHWGSTAAEREAVMPGDELIERPGMSATRSISVAAPAEEVFGYLAQMGMGRAGWYSYDLVDNLGRRSARRLHPEWQVEAVGDEVPAGPISFVVTDIDRPRLLVIAVLDHRLPGHPIDFTLAYRLTPLDGGGTRVVSRARTRISGPLGSPATLALRVGDGIMVRRQLLGLRDRCGVPEAGALS
ncbi:MAG: SRPBCC family protein [Actinomycetota bacterium]